MTWRAHGCNDLPLSEDFADQEKLLTSVGDHSFFFHFLLLLLLLPLSYNARRVSRKAKRSTGG